MHTKYSQKDPSSVEHYTKSGPVSGDKVSLQYLRIWEYANILVYLTLQWTECLYYNI